MPTAANFGHTAGARSNHAGAGRGQGRGDSPAHSQTWAAGGHQGQQALRMLAETLCVHVSARSELHLEHLRSCLYRQPCLQYCCTKTRVCLPEHLF